MLLSRLIAAAIAGSLPTACGGEPSTTSGGDGGPDGARDATSSSDGTPDDTTSPRPDTGPSDAGASDVDGGHVDAGDADAGSCVHGLGAVLSVTPSGDAAAADADVLWGITFAVDPTCCEPQVRSVQAWGFGEPNLAAACNYNMELPCGAADAGVQQCQAWCDSVPAPIPPMFNGVICQIGYDDAGAANLDCQFGGSGCGFGRPPRTFVARRVQARSALGRHLAWMAQLEAASVAAFEALHADLARLGAPRSLLRDVKAAARDEVRHARSAEREARRHGAHVPTAVVPPIPNRSLEALAIDNAGEGCVRETFGAALAAVQAQRATDPTVRAMMGMVARDELRHAALSWRLALWLEARLDAAGRTRVRSARAEALAALEQELSQPIAGAVQLGMPGAEEQRRLLAALRGPLETGFLTAA